VCLAKVYLAGNGENELIAEEIASLKTDGHNILVTTLFGEQQELTADIKEIDFRGSHVFLEKVPE
jgi:predicted RNA-binding protein